MAMTKKVLAVSSGGGHWVQMGRLLPAFEEHQLVFVTVKDAYRETIPKGARFYVVRDATIWNKVGLLILSFQILCILFRERPDVVLSTGAAPGYFAIRLGKWFGARTVWLDSVANVDKMSLSGEKVKRYADLWLTQWPELARPEGPYYKGSVI
jgi:UDP-N-acetylglucosamine:LPS N-acetylglucosamine transferase